MSHYQNGRGRSDEHLQTALALQRHEYESKDLKREIDGHSKTIERHDGRIKDLEKFKALAMEWSVRCLVLLGGWTALGPAKSFGEFLGGFLKAYGKASP